MYVWAIANQKGGTGKTTTAIHLAGAFARSAKRVLLIDLDPQAHASLGLGVAPGESARERNVEPVGNFGGALEKATSDLSHVFLDGVPLRSIVRTVAGGVALAPGSLALGEFEEASTQRLGPERVLSEALESVSDLFDHVVIDCPPRADGVLCANAVRAANTVLLAVEVGAFALQGAIRARALFEQWADELGFTMDLRVIATLFDRRTRFGRDVLIAMQARFGDAMLNTAIRQSVRLREAAAYGTTIQELSPRSSAAADFRALALELQEHAGARTAPSCKDHHFSALSWAQLSSDGEPARAHPTQPSELSADRTTPDAKPQLRPARRPLRTPRTQPSVPRPEEGVGGPF